MKIVKHDNWVFYISDEGTDFDEHKCGKWMYFFSDKEYAAKVCREAVEKNIVAESKHSDEQTGTSCFYLNIDDIEGHKKVIQFFLDNNLIRKTGKGKLYNISFKLDDQTRNSEYGNDFVAELKLDMFIDLETGEWKF